MRLAHWFVIFQQSFIEINWADFEKLSRFIQNRSILACNFVLLTFILALLGKLQRNSYIYNDFNYLNTFSEYQIIVFLFFIANSNNYGDYILTWINYDSKIIKYKFWIILVKLCLRNHCKWMDIRWLDKSNIYFS